MRILLALLLLPITAWAQDTDGDGVLDVVDNCSQAANASQCDSNGDGIGNWCDGDFNNDGQTNIFDLGIFKHGFGGTDPDLDLNCDGAVNIFDLGRFKAELFGNPPGPSCCDAQILEVKTKADLQTSGGVFAVPGVGGFVVPWWEMPEGSAVEVWRGGVPALPSPDLPPASEPVRLVFPPGITHFALTLESGDYISRYTGRDDYPYDLWESGETVYLDDTIIDAVREWWFTPLFGERCDYPVSGGEVTWIVNAFENCDTKPQQVTWLEQAIAEKQAAFQSCDLPFFKILVIPRHITEGQAWSNRRWVFYRRDWLQAQNESQTKSSTYHELQHVIQGHLVSRDGPRTWLIESAASLAEAIVDPANPDWLSRILWNNRLPARGLGGVLRESLYDGVAYLHHVRQAMPTFDLCDWYTQERNAWHEGDTRAALDGYIGVGPALLHHQWQHNFHHYRNPAWTPYADQIPSGPAEVVDLDVGATVLVGNTVQWTNHEQTYVCLHITGNPAVPADTVVTMTDGNSLALKIQASAVNDNAVNLRGTGPLWYYLQLGAYTFAVSTAEGVPFTDDQYHIGLQVTREQCP